VAKYFNSVLLTSEHMLHLRADKIWEILAGMYVCR
jgi:hypothetical protein